MMICIFPVLFVVILLPVVVRLHLGNYWDRRHVIECPRAATKPRGGFRRKRARRGSARRSA
jgi:hypothetical protein